MQMALYTCTEVCLPDSTIQIFLAYQILRAIPPPTHTQCWWLTSHIFTVSVHPVKAASTLDHLAFVVTVSVGLLAHRTEVALVSKLVAVCTAGESIVPQGRLVLEGKGGEEMGGEERGK